MILGVSDSQILALFSAAVFSALVLLNVKRYVAKRKRRAALWFAAERQICS